MAPADKQNETVNKALYTVEDRIEELRIKFPHGTYWNYLKDGSEPDPDKVTDTPCASHYGDAYGCYCCNVFDGAKQCLGFAYKVFYDIHGVYARSLPRRYDVRNIQVGDVVRLSGDTHSGVVIGRDGDGLVIVDCNQSTNGSMYRCHIRWDCENYSIWSVTYFMHSEEVAQTPLIEQELTFDEADGSADFLLTSLIAAPLTEENTAITLEDVLGDVDRDGRLTAADARLALHIAIGVQGDLTEEQMDLADVDGEPGVSAADARRILIAAVGLDPLH